MAFKFKWRKASEAVAGWTTRLGFRAEAWRGETSGLDTIAASLSQQTHIRHTQSRSLLADRRREQIGDISSGTTPAHHQVGCGRLLRHDLGNL